MKRLLMICLFVGCTVAMKGQYWGWFIDVEKEMQYIANFGIRTGELGKMLAENEKILEKEILILGAAEEIKRHTDNYVTALQGGITKDYLRFKNIGKKVEKIIERTNDIIHLAQKNKTSLVAIVGKQYMEEYGKNIVYIGTKLPQLVVGKKNGELLRIDQRVALLREVDKKLDDMLYIVNKIYDRMCLFDKNGFLVFQLYDMGLYNKYQVADYKTQIAKEIVEEHFKDLKR